MKLAKKLFLLLPFLITSLVGCNFNEESYDEGLNFTHIILNLPVLHETISFNYTGEDLMVDWGDGVINQETSHTYEVTQETSINIYGNITSLRFCDDNGDPLSIDNIFINTIVLANTITTIYQNSFILPCLQEVIIPHSVQTIEMNAFISHGASCRYFCGHSSRPVGWHTNWLGVNPMLNSVFWGSHITFLDDMLFISFQHEHNYRTSLIQYWASEDETEIIIPEKIVISNIEYPVINIGASAFQGSRIKKVVLPSSLLSIGNGAFSECLALANVDTSKATHLQYIDDRAFAHCPLLVEFTIPASLSYLGDCVFANCGGLTSLKVDPDNQVYHSLNGNYNVVQGEYLVTGCPMNEDGDFFVPEGIVTIGKSALENVIVENIYIPTSVKKIEYHACYGVSCRVDLTNIHTIDEIPFCEEEAFSVSGKVIEESVVFLYNRASFGVNPDAFYQKGFPEASIPEHISWIPM